MGELPFDGKEVSSRLVRFPSLKTGKSRLTPRRSFTSQTPYVVGGLPGLDRESGSCTSLAQFQY